MSETKHSPTPWKFIAPVSGYKAGIDSAEDRAVVWISSHSDEGIKHESDAAHIVKCVNLHDELVTALADCKVFAGLVLIEPSLATDYLNRIVKLSDGLMEKALNQ